MLLPMRVRPLPLDITAWLDSGIVSLSIELQPLRKADEVAALLLALRQYPEGLPKRDQKIADARVGEYTIERAGRPVRQSGSSRLARLCSSSATAFRKMGAPSTSPRLSTTAWHAQRRRHS